MRTFSVIVGDFFNTAMATWIVLVVLELFNPGMVHRLINLEYYFYGLVIVYIFYRYSQR